MKGDGADTDVKQVHEAPVWILISVFRKLAVDEPDIAGVESDIHAFCVTFYS
jgi:hypothetical protein